MHEKFGGLDPNPPKSSTAYYHDQKGRWTDPMKVAVNPYKPDTEGLQQEIEDIRSALKFIQGKKTVQYLFGSLLKNCERYVECIANIATERGERAENSDRSGKFPEEIKLEDEKRKNIHNLIIGDLTAIKRFLSKNYGPAAETEENRHSLDQLPFMHLYSDATGTARDEVGEWAVRMAKAIAFLSDDERKILGPLIK